MVLDKSGFRAYSGAVNWGINFVFVMVGAVISSVPLMILYFFAQRFIVAGMTEGSVKG